MSTKVTELVPARYMTVVRSFIASLGLIAIWWGVVGLPVFWRDSSLERIAAQVIAGEPFKGRILIRQLAAMDKIEKSRYCHPAAIRSAALIRLRMFEENGFESGQAKSDEGLNVLDSAIRKTISCSPADPFLWIVLFWIESSRNGVNRENLTYLRMSYSLGSSEGWVALKRNPIVVRAFGLLPPDIVKNAVNEFRGLVDSRFYDAAANILIGPGWNAKDQLVSGLNTIAQNRRQAFADVLHDRGYDVSVPGIRQSDVPHYGANR